jgi:hypothetical protein
VGQPSKLRQQAFRLVDDDAGLNAGTFRQPLNQDDTQGVDQNYRIRFCIQQFGGSNGSIQAQLEYNLKAAGWNPVTESSSVIRSTDSGYYSDEDATTERLNQAGVFVAGKGDDADGTGGICGSVTLQVDPDEETEFEFCYQIRSADVSDSDTIELRVTDNGSILDTYVNTPTITVSAGTAHEKNLADSVTVSEAADAEVVKAAADSVAPTEAISDKAVAKGLADSVTPGESASRQVAFVRAPADSVTPTESPAFTVQTYPADSVTVTEVPEFFSGTELNLDDSVTVSEGIDYFEVEKGLADSVSPADAFERTVAFERTFSDSVTVTEAPAIGVELYPDDSVTVSEGITGFEVDKGLDDSVSVGEAPAISLGYIRAPSDAVSVTEAAETILAKNLDDSVAAAEAAPSLALGFVRSLADSVSVSESEQVLHWEGVSEWLRILYGDQEDWGAGGLAASGWAEIDYGDEEDWA